MSADVSVAVIGAVAVVIASIIGLIVAVTTAVIAKEQKVSEFRQAWINEFRDDIALTLKNAYTCYYHRQTYLNLKTKEEKAISMACMDEAFTNFELKTISIKLKLNPTKDIKFIELLKKSLTQVDNIDIHSNTSSVKKRFEIAKTSLSLLEAEAHTILKKEWEVVKNGENRFQSFKRLGKFCAGMFLIAMYMLFAIAIIRSPIFSL
jgi:hypothetical protein